MEEAAAPAELPIHEFLRERLRDYFGGVLSRLAEACDTTPSHMAKWVSELSERRSTPSPSSCQKIADGLGLPLDYVLALAGHRPATEDAPSESPVLAAIIGTLRKRWEDLQEPEQRVILATVHAVAGGEALAVQPTQRRSSGRSDAVSKRLKRRQSELERGPQSAGADSVVKDSTPCLGSALRELVHRVAVLGSPDARTSVAAAGL